MGVVKLSQALATALCNLAVDSLDDGSAGAAQLIIYQGTMPASVDTPITTEVELVVFDLPNPVFGDAAPSGIGATATAEAITPVEATATGGDPNPLFARLFDRDGAPVIDLDVGDDQSTASLKIDATTIVQGVNVSIVSLTFSQRKQ